jgi:hypothetical protein
MARRIKRFRSGKYRNRWHLAHWEAGIVLGWSGAAQSNLDAQKIWWSCAVKTTGTFARFASRIDWKEMWVWMF